MDVQSGEWIDNEVVGCEIENVRDGKRLRQLLEQLSYGVGATGLPDVSTLAQALFLSMIHRTSPTLRA